MYYSIFYIEKNIELILDKRPNRKHVIDLLAKNAHEYRKFAIALDVDKGFVKGLSGDDNVEKLDEIIEQWMTTRSCPVTWRTIIEAVKSDTLGNNIELAEKIMEWVKKDENLDYYLKQKK